MYGLPILRKKSDLEFPDEWKPKTGDPLVVANPLVEMSGNHFTIAVCVDWKRMLGWGSNFPTDGILGFSGSKHYPTLATFNRAIDPVTKVKEDSKISKVRSTGTATILLTETGYLYGTGSSPILKKASYSYEFITDKVAHFDYCGTNNNQYSPYPYMILCKSDGKVYGIGVNHWGFGIGPTATTLTSLTYLNIDNVKRVWCVSPESGKGRSYVLKNDGTVWACGDNVSGALSVGDSNGTVFNNRIDTWKQVYTQDSAGNIRPITDVVDILPSNFVWVGGANGAAGGLWGGGSGTTFSSVKFLKSNGEVWSAGSNKFGLMGCSITSENENTYYAKKVNINGVIKMAGSAGGSSIIVATNDNKIYTWGSNQWGQLGTNDYVNKNSPQLITLPTSDLVVQLHGGGHYGNIHGAFIILTNVGEIYSAGYNYTYSLGIVDINLKSVAGNIKTFTKNYYFGPNSPNQVIAKSIDLCGYGSEMAQKVLGTNSKLYMSGWNQDVNGVKNFNPAKGQLVEVPDNFTL